MFEREGLLGPLFSSQGLKMALKSLTDLQRNAVENWLKIMGL